MKNESQQTFAYEIKENSVVIWRCFSLDSRVEIPEMIEDLPVVWIAPYAFSAHMDKDKIQKGLDTGKLKLYIPPLGKSETEAVCGNFLEEIVFPKTVMHVGRYCFYNCDHLRAITFYGTLSDWGSGAFTGVHHVRKLTVYSDHDQRSYLKEVLEELPEETAVHYFVAQSDGSYKETHLMFPEFYEEGVENTPAKLTEVRYHGSGMRFRNCFKNRKFEFSSYDKWFDNAVILEEPQIVAQLAIGRLFTPYELSEPAKEQYLTYVKEHFKDITQLYLANDDLEGIKWFLDLMKKNGMDLNVILNYMTEEASVMHKAEIMSYLMDFRKSAAPVVSRRKRLEL